MTTEAQGTEADIRSQCPAALLPVYDELVTLVRKHAGACQEIAWPKQKILSFGLGPKKMSEHHCYVAIYSAHINLGFYHGANLPDPSKLLQGTGKGLRHIKITELGASRNKALVQLVRTAIAERQSQFAKQ